MFPAATPPCPCHPGRGHVGFGRQRLGARPERAAWRPPLRPRNTPTKVITFGVSGCQRRGRRSSLQRSSRRREPNVEEDHCESRSAGQEGGTESPCSLRITPAASSTSHGAATDDRRDAKTLPSKPCSVKTPGFSNRESRRGTESGANDSASDFISQSSTLALPPGPQRPTRTRVAFAQRSGAEGASAQCVTSTTNERQRSGNDSSARTPLLASASRSRRGARGQGPMASSTARRPTRRHPIRPSSAGGVTERPPPAACHPMGRADMHNPSTSRESAALDLSPARCSRCRQFNGPLGVSD